MVAVSVAYLVALWATPAWSVTTAYTDPAAFAGALPGPAQTVDFDSLAAGALLPSGSTVNGVTFTYSIAGLTMKVIDTFSTTSGANSLGLTGGDDAFLDGDTFDLAFSPALALGMFFITSDAAIADEMLLITSVGTAGNSATPFQVLADGGIAYFVGLISTDTTFSSATVDFLADGEINFAFNVDDITTAVPEPGSGLLVALGVGVLGFGRRRLGAGRTTR